MSFDLLAEFASPKPSASQPHAQRSQNVTSATPTPNKRFSFFDDLADLTITSPGAGSPRPDGLSGAKAAAPARTVVAASAPAPAEIEPQANDDWGDFEDAPAQLNSTTTKTTTTTNASGLASDPWGDLNSFSSAGPHEPMPTVAPTANTSSAVNDPFDLGSWEAPASAPAQKAQAPATLPSRPRKPSAPKDPNVLFDAEDLSEDDDFGDFEGEEVPQGQASGIDDLDFLSPVEAPKADTVRQGPTPIPKPLAPPVTFGTATRSATKSSKTPTNTTRPKTTTVPKSRPAPAQPPPSTDFDEWDDFTESLPTATAEPPAAASSSSPPALPIPTTPQIPDPSPQELPPTNIPPPALLLTLFPPIFSTAQNALFKPLSSQPAPVKAKILAHPQTLAFVRGYLAIGTVAARVIAGRKLRWKRDAFLVQSMSIGPATGGKAGGMKLTAIDRSEATKEDREAADVVRAWREQLGRLRTAVMGVNAAAGGGQGQVLGIVPEISETMPVRTAKEMEGGVTAPRACAVCGLKRNERVGKVDGVVEDSFGEWWVDQVAMHRACRNFWEEHKARLRY